MADDLKPKVFSTSRLAEFCAPDNLVRQIGHDVDDWPDVILKELVDNALDACEVAGVAPVITIVLTAGGILVADNGPGISPETVAAITDYATRTSSREAYCSPTRGAQGNALQTILAMGHATGKGGKTVIESVGVRHTITFDVDPIVREPRIEHVTEATKTRTTSIIVSWPVDPALKEIAHWASRYHVFNPHLTMTIGVERSDTLQCNAIDPTWRKWRPSDPTSPHWYDVPTFANLIAENIRHADAHGLPCRTVGDFASEFRGLSGSAKRRDICDKIGASRMTLADLFRSGSLAPAHLLRAMQAASKPVKVADLGVIGADILGAMFMQQGAAEESFRYKKVEVIVKGVPYLAEVAFAFAPKMRGRLTLTGLNWSIAVGGSPFEDLGDSSEGLGEILAEHKCYVGDPVIFFLHVASPRLEYLNTGKSEVSLPYDVEQAIIPAITHVTKAWTRQRKAKERDASAEARRKDRLAKIYRPITQVKAAEVMREAYLWASDNNTLPANARQVMYAARKRIMELTDRTYLDDQYFCQTLLPDYMNAHQRECACWDIVWSDRGHFAEPHGGRTIGLGTLAVREYVGDYHDPELVEAGVFAPNIKTTGPSGRYGGLLYIEKEGFDELVERAQIANKFDLCIFSCKGVSVTAARQLVDQTCAKYKIPLYILHDFDISGFTIAKTLCSDTRRYQFETRFKVVDLGLRLSDVEALGLADSAEPVFLGKGNKNNRRATLRAAGAKPEEVAFLLDGGNPRAEVTTASASNSMR